MFLFVLIWRINKGNHFLYLKGWLFLVQYINVGVRWRGSGERVKTKLELKQALASQPETVVFDQTSALTPSHLPQQLLAADIPDDTTLIVCGPNPFDRRIWWASVRPRSGKVVVT